MNIKPLDAKLIYISEIPTINDTNMAAMLTSELGAFTKGPKILNYNTPFKEMQLLFQ
jgi:hypothetical protein